MLTAEQKRICFEFLKAGLRPNHPDLAPPIFKGMAGDYQRFNDPSFQELAQKCGINSETVILVYRRGDDIFGVKIMK